jgi:hypothetical protein
MLKDGVGLLGTITSQRLSKLRVLVSEHGSGEQRCVDRARPPDRQGSDGDAGWHLDD